MQSNSQNLPIRESILGVLKSKDLSNQRRIHSSDFNDAISELGFSMGSPIIEDLLIYCKLDNSGYIDFSELEKELKRQRKIFNSQFKPEPVRTATSSGVVPKPWRGDETHKSKQESEQQLQAISENSTVINQLYGMLSHRRISADEVVDQIYQLDITPTPEFLKIVREMEINPVPYSEFIQALTRVKPNSSNIASGQVPAGGFRVRPEVNGETIGSQRKRVTGMKTAFHQSEVTPPRSYRKMVNNQPVNDQTIFKTKEIKSLLFFEDEGGNVPLLSHNLQDMISGSTGVNIEVNYNIDQRLQREQVAAALRKLDTGMISMQDFQDILVSIGIDIPENFISEVQRGVISGRLDVRHCLKMLDANIFKSSAIENSLYSEEQESAIQKFKNNLLKLGHEAFHDLALVFKRADVNNDNKLTYAEFKGCCAELGVARRISDNELRSIFHAFDKNGDGHLQYEEFVECLRGSLNARRKQLVRKAFQSLDIHNSGEVSIDLVGDRFNALAHPLVRDGVKSAKEVTTDFLRWFSIDEGFRGNVKFDPFLDYFANFSSSIESDEEFAAIISGIWNLSDLAPPPPMLKVKKGKEVVTPLAMQTHGDLISWQQIHSSIEEKETAREMSKGRKVVGQEMKRNFQSDVIGWKNHHIGTAKTPDKAVSDELKEFGVESVSSGRKNASSKSLLECLSSNTPKSTKRPQVATATAAPETKLPFQEEYPLAGRPSHFTKQSDVVTPTKNKLLEYHSGVPPFGVDPQPAREMDLTSPTNGAKVKSLSEIVKMKGLKNY